MWGRCRVLNLQRASRPSSHIAGSVSTMPPQTADDNLKVVLRSSDTSGELACKQALDTCAAGTLHARRPVRTHCNREIAHDEL